MKIAILGFGREGRSLLRFLRNRGLTQKITRTHAEKNEIWILDKNPDIRIPRGVKAELGKNYLKNLGMFDTIFRSPGVPYLSPEIQAYEKRASAFGSSNPNTPTRIISSPTKLFFDLIANKLQATSYKLPAIIGITGTKGKGTTSTLLYKILKAHRSSSGQTAGKDVYLAGNIGLPALDILPKLKENSVVILELSSFQLQDLEASPHIAIVLTMFPDHQDVHRNLKEYYDAKTNIARYQKPNDKIFFFGDDKLSRWIAEKSRGKKIPLDTSYIPNSPASSRPARRGRGGREWWNKVKKSLKIPGEHNFKNAVMAATVARSLGVSDKTILKTVRSFHGLEHRLEFVREISMNYESHTNLRIRSDFVESPRLNRDKFAKHSISADRVIRFYNDSASTSPQTTAAAINAFPEEKILIAGGYDKNLNYQPLAKTLKNSKTKLVILFGRNKEKIKRQILNSKCQIKTTKNLESAVEIAYKTAKKLINQLTNNSIAIVFSPGAASFDMFENYADRGQQFKKLVKQLQ